MYDCDFLLELTCLVTFLICKYYNIHRQASNTISISWASVIGVGLEGRRGLGDGWGELGGGAGWQGGEDGRKWEEVKWSVGEEGIGRWLGELRGGAG